MATAKEQSQSTIIITAAATAESNDIELSLEIASTHL